MQYTRYLESHSVSGARNVFQRACCYHLPRKPNIHLLWAAFEEKQGEGGSQASLPPPLFRPGKRPNIHLLLGCLGGGGAVKSTPAFQLRRMLRRQDMVCISKEEKARAP